MVASVAFVLGFFTAFGAWTAGKITKRIDNLMSPPAIEIKQETEKEQKNVRQQEYQREN